MRIAWDLLGSILREYSRVMLTGTLPHPHLTLFFINTSAMWFLVWLAVALILVLISAGSWIGTDSKKLPIGTPLFIFAYCFLVPTWLATAVFRAVFRMGVQWR